MILIDDFEEQILGKKMTLGFSLLHGTQIDPFQDGKASSNCSYFRFNF